MARGAGLSWNLTPRTSFSRRHDLVASHVTLLLRTGWCLLMLIPLPHWRPHRRRRQHSRPPHCPNQMSKLKLWCYFEGHRSYFPVSILPSQEINDLRDEIYGKSDKSIPAMDLILTKVRYIMISM